MIPHAIYHVDAEGEIDQEIALPPELLAHEIRFGFEGITVAEDVLWIAVQGEWKDDTKGLVKRLAYNAAKQTWGAVHYPLDMAGEGAWMGLSEITVNGDWASIVERDNQVGASAVTKRIYRVKAADIVAAEIGGALPVMTKKLVRDLMPDLGVLNRYTAEKVERCSIDVAGTGWVVTDNDGVADISGETLFWSIGAVK